MTDVPIFPFNASVQALAADVDRMGAKGAGLVEMSAMGLPVPPGFVVGTAIGAQIAKIPEGEPVAVSDDVMSAARAALAAIERETGRTFGGEDRPLLLSVRSGAAVSMPGMMDTVLDLGLNDRTVEALARETGDERFAWDSYRRFIQGFSQVVLEIPDDDYEMALEDMRERCGVEQDSQLPAEALKELVARFLQIVEGSALEPFPQDVTVQLQLALVAVFKSWNTDRAVRYRETHGFSHDGGSAATVQAMVFGNRDERSCSGVFFTRNPSTGTKEPFGEYMPNAQGEDVVSGVRTPNQISERAREDALSDGASMEAAMPDVLAQLIACGERLERHFRDVQEIEFTVEAGRLYLLQTRKAKRNSKAALRIAIAMAEEGLISKADAVERCGEDMLAPMLVSKVDANGVRPFTKGLPASPGAVSGEVVFTSDEAVALAATGRNCILVRPETDPKDVHGMSAALGILTSRGGMTSHAAVVARGMGKPCITAAMSLKIDLDGKSCSSAGRRLNSGDAITVDGGSGFAFADALPVVKPQPDGDLAKLLSWKDAL